jgi:MFS family permease
MGFGAFLAFYLADLEWSKEDVGIALAIGNLAAVVALAPGGAVADAVRWKRALVALGIAAIALSALMLAIWPSFWAVIAAELLHGATAGVVLPGIAAITLGIVGRQNMSIRIGRNYRFGAAGNSLTAAAMGLLGAYVSHRAIFIATALLCIPALLALTRINPNRSIMCAPATPQNATTILTCSARSTSLKIATWSCSSGAWCCFTCQMHQ